MSRRCALLACSLLALSCLNANMAPAAVPADLAREFQNPPDSARPRVYWWWLNGLVSKEGITRDLEEFRAKGIGGVLLFDAGFPAGPMPAGPPLLSPQWREFFRHALREADRLGLEVSVNLSSGWAAGGPWITPEHACKHILHAELKLKGPRHFSEKLPLPPGNVQGYRDVAVQAFRESAESKPAGQNEALALKSARASLDCATTPIRRCVEAALTAPESALSGPAISPNTIVDLTAKVAPDGRLDWDVPPGEWTIVRTGYALTGQRTAASSPGGEGPESDWLSPAAMEHHFRSTAEVLLKDAGPLAGKTLKYFHDDSWEVGLPNWTPQFLAEFRKLRGYDARPYLPVLAGRVVTSPEVSDRFLYDYRKTLADCMAEHHYARFGQLAHARGVGIHPESGGPCCPSIFPMDALKNLGRGDIPMGEFWQSIDWKTARHTATGAHVMSEFWQINNWKEHGQNKVAKQTSSAAHIYGKRLAAAEAFTSIGPHWMETPASLKPTADIAFCEGINRCVMHTATSTRPEDGRPGYAYLAGTHFNPNVTWWNQSGAWLGYLSRCQYLLQQGLFVADVCYYYGDHAPNLVEPKHVEPSLGPGYDYDVCNAEVLLERMTVCDGRLVLPDGMSYRLLVLPDRATMPVEVLRKVKELAEAGATIVGPRPQRDPGLRDYPRCDREVKSLAAAAWGDCDGRKVQERRVGRGRIVWGKPLRGLLQAEGIGPDFEFSGGSQDALVDFLHRRDGETEIYFLANRRDRAEQVQCTFRVTGKQPELWDPIRGEIRDARAYAMAGQRTSLPLEFPPFGSTFVVFRRPATAARGPATTNSPSLVAEQEIGGPWTVQFDPKWGGPASVPFERLVSWPERPEDGIKHYSGTAKYRRTFDLPEALRRPGQRVALDLGEVKNIAEVRLNGKNLGVLWTSPFRVDVTDAVKPAGNQLEIEVTNLWPNRLIGDLGLPPEKRFTRTNVTIFTKDSRLLDSGLLGPVRLLRVADE